MEMSMRIGFKTDSNVCPEYKSTARITITGDKEIVEMVKIHIEKMRVDPRPVKGWTSLNHIWFLE